MGTGKEEKGVYRFMLSSSVVGIKEWMCLPILHPVPLPAEL